MKHTVRCGMAVAFVVSAMAGASAQEKLGAHAPEPGSPPGWSITPSFGYGGTFDDNISLFGINTAEAQNNDFISTYQPGIEVGYAGRHTHLGIDYGGSLLNYRTFTALNRWDQHGHLELRRQESARLKWFVRAAAAALPSTDLVELGGIPYRHTGVRTADGRGGVVIALGARDNITASVMEQVIDFDRPANVSAFLRGGHVLESLNAWRHKLGSRLSVGTDYSFRRALVSGDVEQFSIHTTESAVEYELSPVWTFSGGLGFVYLESTSTTAARSGPAWRAAFDRRYQSSSFHVGYERSFIPSFGYGGTVKNEEAGVGYRTALFGSRHWYTEQSAVFRDDTPLVSTAEQLPLRSFRTMSILGFAPEPWVRMEVFYTRIDQTSLRAGGRLYRNRVGFQIVTSKPVRVS
jgi:hypothetical protein